MIISYCTAQAHFLLKNYPCPPLNKKTLVYFLKNFFTLGIYTTVKNFSKNQKIIYLKIQEKEKKETLQNIEELKNLFEKVVNKREVLKKNNQADLLKNLSKTKLKHSSLIFLIKSLVANWLTAGIHGVFQRENLKKYLIKLKKENKDLSLQLQLLMKDQQTLLLEELNKKSLPPKINSLETQVEVVKSQKAAEKMILANEALIKEKNKKAEKYKKLKKKHSELVEKHDKLQQDYHRQTQAAMEKYEYEEEAFKLREQVESYSVLNHHLAQLGPIELPYFQELENQKIMTKGKISSFDANLLAQKTEASQRYALCKTVEQLIFCSFSFVANFLFDQNKTKEKYQITNSYLTKGTPGFDVVYRLMALDLIQAATLTPLICENGYVLKIGPSDILLLPSLPEKVLRCKKGLGAAKEFEVVNRYQQLDDLTAHESIGTRVDPVSIKIILQHLTSKEQSYLKTWLASAIIEDDHLDQKELSDFLHSSHGHAKLVETAFRLITDLSWSLKRKFGDSVILQCWKEMIHKQIISEEKEEIYIKGGKIDKEQTKKADSLLVDWKIEPRFLEKSFYDSFELSKQRYQLVLKNLKPEFLLHPLNANEKIPNLTLEALSSCYYLSHNMLKTKDKQHYCLFSNLLTILMSQVDEVKGENVFKLKKALAHYLEAHPDQFKEEISQVHQCSFENYLQGLREESDFSFLSLSNLSILEIKIAAFTFGVRIIVLPLNTEGQQVEGLADNQGRLVANENLYVNCEGYGPYTEEILIMGCARGNGSTPGSYYGLFPKLELKHILKDEVKEAAQHLQSYWKTMDQLFHQG